MVSVATGSGRTGGQLNFAALLGLPGAAVDQGVLVWVNVSHPGWWLGQLAAGSIVIVVAVWRGARTRDLPVHRRGVIAALQIAFLAAAALVFAQPALEVPSLRAGENTVAVLIDTSASMGLAADIGAATPDRLSLARDLLAETLAPGLAEVAQLVVFNFDSGARRQSGKVQQPDGLVTHLHTAIEEVIESFSHEALAAVIVLSDGADTSGMPIPVAGAGASAGVPIHTIGLGPTELPGEVRLNRVVMPTSVSTGSVVTASVALSHSTDGATATVQVRGSGRLLASKTVELRKAMPNLVTELSFDSGPAGIRDLHFEVVSEIDGLPQNNQLPQLLTVRERKHRVLYLEGEPRWEYKYLRRALARDDVLEVVSWLKTTDRKTYRQGASDSDDLAEGLPAGPEALFDFDVIILGSIRATEFDEAQHAWLETFISERGGSVLALAGREALADGGWDVQPLAQALPVSLSRENLPTYSALADGAVIATTEAGRNSPLVRLFEVEGGDAWGTLPPLADLQRVAGLKPGATTLLELREPDGSVAPLLVVQPYGLGNSAVLATATTWRWQMRTPAADQRHRLFWRHLVRQLAEFARPVREVAVSADSASRLQVQVVQATSGAGDSLHARITSPEGEVTLLGLATTDVPGTFAGRSDSLSPGLYRVDVDLATADETRTRFVRVGGRDVEFDNPVQDAARLTRIAETTGGRYWHPDSVADLPDTIRYASAGIHTVELLPIWSIPLAFFVLLALKLLEWSLRRYWGRV